MAAVTDSQLLRLRANPQHPQQPGQPAAGVRQIGRPGARPGPGLGAIGQHGRQQVGQRIGRGGHRRGRGGGAAAGFPQADRRGRGGQLEQAQGPAAGTVGQQLGGHHPAQLLTDRGGGGAAVPAGAGSAGRGGDQGLGQPGSGGGLQPERIGPAAQAGKPGRVVSVTAAGGVSDRGQGDGFPPGGQAPRKHPSGEPGTVPRRVSGSACSVTRYRVRC